MRDYELQLQGFNQPAFNDKETSSAIVGWGLIMVPKGWIELSDLNGNALTFAIQQIVCVGSPAGDEIPGAKCIVECSNGKIHGVGQLPAAVVQKIADDSATS